MKFKRSLATILTATFTLGALSGCGGSDEATGDDSTEDVVVETTGEIDEFGLDENLMFPETRHISVEIYDRGNEGGTDPTDNMYTDYIKDGMMEQHNVAVDFVSVPRWTETDEINNLLAAGTAPDICVTYSAPTIQTYAEMGGVLDLAEYVDNKDLFPNLWNLLGDTNIYWDQDPETGELYCLEALLANNARCNTFIREDWLNTLGLEVPTTEEEFEDCLIAFRDNADLLLGEDADKMIPFSLSYDVGYRATTLENSYTPADYSDKDRFVNGFDDRYFLYDGNKEAIRTLNKWYNEGLIWQDFALYGPGDPTEDNYMKSGYTGAFIGNWDYPYRNGEDSIQANMQNFAGEDAAYIAIDTFQDENGNYTKFLSPPIDRKVFFPTTNDEPIASLLYLDFMSDPETIKFLQMGVEGTNYEVLDDGSYKMLSVSSGESMQNSPQNLDYTITINGLDLGDDELTLSTLANSYPSVDPEYITRAYTIAINDGVVGKNANVGTIDAETGLSEALADKRDVILNKSIVASEEDFDSVYDKGYEEYMKAGGQAIHDEREEKWAEYFGDSDTIPSN